MAPITDAQREALLAALREIAIEAGDLARFWEDTAPQSSARADGIRGLAERALAAYPDPRAPRCDLCDQPSPGGLPHPACVAREELAP